MLPFLRSTGFKCMTTSPTGEHFWFLNPNLFLQILHPRLPLTPAEVELLHTHRFKPHSCGANKKAPLKLKWAKNAKPSSCLHKLMFL